MRNETQVLEQNEIDAPRRAEGRRQSKSSGGDYKRTLEWIAQATAVCERAKRGDLEARILGYAADDELGQLFTAINDMLDITDAFVRESRASLEYAS